ncbi:phosphatase PAP2 family protein [Erythrobacter vulgaris]|uniref:Phosphatase PAP2 family protein n=1 Tax=Qipengyuania vulgaris TaxID=291985 RepID=A0A844XWB0_9SPHN|nr:phosphatase PAP2 family protein [Qipengyuania vulgaris]MXO49649.1 phosphatase PAP2 family protein [Qipengyuania vulgaris]
MTQDECEKRDWNELASNIGRWTLIGGAILKPILRGDGRAAMRAAVVALTAGAMWQTAKAAVDRWRPDGEDDNSFPSGHTADAAAAAASLVHDPASHPMSDVAVQALALATGVARWRCRKHHIGDVAAGIVIGLLAEKAVRVVLPWR